MVVALKPLHDLARIKRVVVATYQSVSGAGREAMDELFSADPRRLRQRPGRRQSVSPSRSPSTCIPHIDVFMDDGSTKEEWKMVVETRKILDPDIAVVRDLRARAGLHRPCRGGQCRVRAAAQRGRGARGAEARRRASSSSITAPMKAMSRRSKPRARTRSMSAASAAIRPCRTA